MIDKCAYEFATTEHMLAAAEAIAGMSMTPIVLIERVGLALRCFDRCHVLLFPGRKLSMRMPPLMRLAAKPACL